MKVKVRKHKKSPAPRSTEQVKIESTIEKLRKTRTYGVPIHVVYDRGYQNIASAKNSETLNSFITSEQKKQIADALVTFVIRATDSTFGINKEEASVLPFVLDFLVKVDSSEGLKITSDDKTISNAVLPDLHKMIEKFVESRKER